MLGTVEEEGLEEEPGAIGVRGLLENGRCGPKGVDLLLDVVPGVLEKMFAFSKLANEGCEIDVGAWELVGEAKGSLELTLGPGWLPNSANKSNEVEDFGVDVFDPVLVLLFSPPLTDPDDCEAVTFGRDTDELAVSPALLVSLFGVEAFDDVALEFCGGIFFRAILGSI